MKKSLLILITLLSTYFAQAQIVKVNAAATGANDGTSWVDAYTDLQTAIANTSSGSIWVVAGTYYPGTSGSNAATFTLKNNVQILGGFDGTEGGPTTRNPAVNVCILSGDLDQSGTPTAADAYHVVSTANTDQTAILDGFTITGGNAIGSGSGNSGGGILFAPVSAGGSFDPKIVNCIITGNNAVQDGGAISIISVNQASVTVSPRFYNCKIYNNHANSAGGGLSAFIFNSNSSLQIENCLFYNNTAGTNGGAMFITGSGTPTLNINVTGCTFATDQSNTDIMYNAGGGVSGAGLVVNNSIFYGIQVGGDHLYTGNNNCGNSGWITGSNNFDIDPLYKNAAIFDFRLSCPSPCINAGDDLAISVFTDITGGTRSNQGVVDVGAYESSYTLPSVMAYATQYTICMGDVTQLYGSGAISYTWTGGVTDGFPFSPTVTDTYTVTGTDANGCVNSNFVSITVNPTPLVSIGYSANIICIGSSVTLYGQGASSYSWTGIVSDNIPFSPGATDTYTVTGTDANGCTGTDMISVFVENPSTLTAGGDYDICSTSTGFLMNGSDGGFANAIWSTLGDGTYDDPNLISGSIYTFGPADMSSTNISLVLTATPAVCPVTSDTMIITRHNAPTANILGSGDLCSNVGNVMLTANSVYAGSLIWTSTGTGNFSSPTSTNTFYGPSPAEVAAGSAHLSFKATANSPYCPDAEDSIIVQIHSAPNPTVWSSYNVCQGDSFLLGFNSPGGTPPFTYQWTNSSATVISTANTDYITPTATESYTYTVSDIFGCTGSYYTTLNYDASENISGLVNVGASPLNSGTVYLIKYSLQTFMFDTLATYDLSTTPGSYLFPTMPHGTYLIKVFPDTLLNPNLLPTYYGDKFQWDSATVINHNCSAPFTANVNMISLLGGIGNGTVSGYVLEGPGFGLRPLYGHDHIMVPGGPLKGIDVKLGRNPGGGIQARTMSDSTGYYHFDSIPNHSYRIYVDIPGLPMDSFYIINVQADSSVNLNYYVDSNSVFPILTPAVGLHNYSATTNDLVLYPNPATSNTSLLFTSEKQNHASIKVFDITGKQVIYIALTNLPKGKHEYQLNFANQQLQSGIYFVELVNENGKQTKKLIVE